MAKRKLPAGVLRQAKKQVNQSGNNTSKPKKQFTGKERPTRKVTKVQWNVKVGDLIQYKAYDYTGPARKTVIRTGFVIKVPKETRATSMDTAYRDQALVMSSKGREYVPMNMISVIQNVILEVN